MAREINANARTASDRFPTTGVELDTDDQIWIDSGAIKSYIDLDDGGSQGCTVVDVDDDTVTVEYPNHGDTLTTTISHDHVRETDLQAGDTITFEYDSVYSDNRVEKTATVEAVRRSRRGKFGGIIVETDAGQQYKISNTGGVKTFGDTYRRIGIDAVVTRAETDDDSDEWDPEPASLRDGETPDEDSHAARNLAMLKQAVDDDELPESVLDDHDDDPRTDGGLENSDAYCGTTTTVDGETVPCEKAPGHDGKHAGHVPEDGPGLTWPLHEWGDAETDGGTETHVPDEDCVLITDGGRDVDPVVEELDELIETLEDQIENDTDTLEALTGERVLVTMRTFTGPTGQHRRTGTILKVQRRDGLSGLEYVVDLDGSGHAYVDRSKLEFLDRDTDDTAETVDVGRVEAFVEDLDRWIETAEERAERGETSAYTPEKQHAKAILLDDVRHEVVERLLERDD